MNFSVAGGDARLLYLASALKNDGSPVSLWGFELYGKPLPLPLSSIRDALSDADAVILPYPAENGRGALNAPFADASMTLTSILPLLKRGAAVFGGRLPERFTADVSAVGCSCFDYSLREELTVANALPTAEGAVQIALEELPRTLHASRCLVIGYGRIGKMLSELLRAFGAEVTVSARRASDFAWIQARSLHTLNTSALSGRLEDFDVIFNTAPAQILTERLLAQTRQDVLIIDLASDPGGVDTAAARALSRRVIHALSLPGRVAPETAGRIICDTIKNIISESLVKEN